MEVRAGELVVETLQRAASPVTGEHPAASCSDPGLIALIAPGFPVVPVGVMAVSKRSATVPPDGLLRVQQPLAAAVGEAPTDRPGTMLPDLQ